MITIIVLGSIIVVQSVLYSVERRDLYRKLMAKNLHEADKKKSPEPKYHSAHRNALKCYSGCDKK